MTEWPTQFEARLSQSPAPLPALTDLGDSLSVLAAAASWPSFCLNEQPGLWEVRRSLAHELHHVLNDNVALGFAKGRYRSATHRGDMLRIAMLLDAFGSDRGRPSIVNSLRADLEKQLHDESPSRSLGRADLLNELDVRDGSLLEGDHLGPLGPPYWQGVAPSDRFFARYFRTKVARTRAEYVNQLEILDLRTASPPRLRIGLSTSILTAGAAATVGLNPIFGIAVILLGLVDATIVIRANLADVRGREAEVRAKQASARAAVAREALLEQIYLVTQGELERSPEVAELVVRTALPAVLRLSESSVDELRALEADDREDPRSQSDG